MIRYYFYCPKCGFEEIVRETLPKGIVPNIRDGYGTPIYHYECPQCHNMDAGYMRFGLGKMSELPDEDQEIYFRHILGMYQNIHGAKG